MAQELNNISNDIQNDIDNELQEFESNMLRERCLKLPDITDKQWQELNINPENRELIEEFLMESTQLRPKTLKQYTSGLHIFAKYIMEYLNNKPIYQLKKKDFLRYQNFLVRHGMSSSGIKFKRASVSTFCNYLELYYFGEDDRFNKFRNIVKGVENPAPNTVYKKVLVSEEEYQLLKETLLEDGRIRDYAMLVTCMETGMRGGELRQLKRLEAYKTIDKTLNYVLSDTIYGKGKGDGKPLEYMINAEALEAMQLYEKTRPKDDGCKYLFVTNYNGVNQVSEGYFESVCREYLSDVVSRRINEHLFRASCSTRLLLKGVSEILVSKYVLHHEDLSTLRHYDLRNFSKEKSQIFATKFSNEDEK